MKQSTVTLDRTSVDVDYLVEGTVFFDLVCSWCLDIDLKPSNYIPTAQDYTYNAPFNYRRVPIYSNY